MKILADRYTLFGLSRFRRPESALIRWHQADISRPDELAAALLSISQTQKIDGIIHLAAHIDLLDRPSEKWEAVNVRGTENILRAAVRHGVSFLIYASSIPFLPQLSPGLPF